jgi:hypothetical protein
MKNWRINNMRNNTFTIYRVGSVESFEIEQGMFFKKVKKKGFWANFFSDEGEWVKTEDFSLTIRFTSDNKIYFFFDI